MQSFIDYDNLDLSSDQSVIDTDSDPVQTLEEFLTSEGITAEIKRVYERPDNFFPDHNARHFSYTIWFNKSNGKALTGWFSQGSAHTEDPTLTEIFDCLLRDSSYFLQSSSFDDFCSNLGYDTDDPKAKAQARKTYNACKRIADHLCAMLDQSVVEDLISGQ